MTHLTSRLALLLVLLMSSRVPADQESIASPTLAAIPDRLVVLTFDDSVKSHYTVAKPILEKYGFGATFFITEGFAFKTDKQSYMTWSEIRALHDAGFEIGNHTRDHASVRDSNVDELEAQLAAIDARCEEHGIPKPTSFAWPGNAITEQALPVLERHGIRFARRGGSPEIPYKDGGGIAYEPEQDHPLLVPTAADARPDWTLADLERGLDLARDGRVAVLQFHGVPEGEHPWVNTPRERFEEYMKHLHEKGYRVIALRDLAKYVDPSARPERPFDVIRRRQEEIARGRFVGGTRLVFELDLAEHPNLGRETCRTVRRALGRRLEALGVLAFRVLLVGPDQVAVELPDETADLEGIRAFLSLRGDLAFHVVDDPDTELDAAAETRRIELARTEEDRHRLERIDWVARVRLWHARRQASAELREPRPTKPSAPPRIVRRERDSERSLVLFADESRVVSGAGVVEATVSIDAATTRPSISLRFDKEHAAQLANLTEAHQGRRLAIVFDDEVISAPFVRGRIGAHAQISGQFSAEEARDLATILAARIALPTRLRLVSETRLPTEP